MAAADGLDAELGGLLFKLRKIQNEVGGKDAAVISVIGEDGKQDKFLTIKEKLKAQIVTAKEVIFICF